MGVCFLPGRLPGSHRLVPGGAGPAAAGARSAAPSTWARPAGARPPGRGPWGPGALARSAAESRRGGLAAQSSRGRRASGWPRPSRRQAAGEASRPSPAAGPAGGAAGSRGPLPPPRGPRPPARGLPILARRGVAAGCPRRSPRVPLRHGGARTFRLANVRFTDTLLPQREPPPPRPVTGGVFLCQRERDAGACSSVALCLCHDRVFFELVEGYFGRNYFRLLYLRRV